MIINASWSIAARYRARAREAGIALPAPGPVNKAYFARYHSGCAREIELERLNVQIRQVFGQTINKPE
jgi:hypothetical protein